MTQRSNDRIEVAGIISRLMLHFYTEPNNAVMKAIAEDWINDLVEFGPAIVAEACREYRHRPGIRRPMIGDVRSICIRLQQERAQPGDQLPPPPGRMTKWMEDLWGEGREGIEARKTALAAQQARYQRAEEWRTTRKKEQNHA